MNRIKLKEYIEVLSNIPALVSANHKYTTDDLIFLNTLIKENSFSKVKPFIQFGNTNFSNYKILLNCRHCNTPVESSLSKTAFINVIRTCTAPSAIITCFSCLNKPQENKTLTKEHKTIKFIDDYVYNKGIITTPFINMLNQYRECNFMPIKQTICKMKYSDFLNTFYWKIIANEKRIQANNKCQLCSEKGVLHTHHNTYANHGLEIDNLSDLIILCETCHEKFHDLYEYI